MKKFIISFFFCFLIINSAFCEKYFIKDVEFENVNCGVPFLATTKDKSILQKLNIQKNATFSSIEEFENYILNLKRELTNLRAFQSIDIDYQINNIEIEGEYEILVSIKLVDSIHLLALPYPKFDSKNGFDFKLKAKDTNFLGTLNPMNADIFIKLPNMDSENQETSFGFNFSYDFPFRIGIINSIFVNNYGISYILGEDLPDWHTQTGFLFSLPLNKVAFNLELYQFTYGNSSYKQFDDRNYFTEEAKFSTPVIIAKHNYFKNITVTPYIDFVYNWDYNQISILNKYLFTPTLQLGFSVSTSRIDWKNNFRNGLSLSLGSSAKYNFMYNDLYPNINTKIQGFYHFNLYDGNLFSRIGVCTSLYTFNYFEVDTNKFIYGESVGGYLRGIRDNQIFGNTGNCVDYTTSSAIIFNLDLPIHLFTTYVNWPFFKHLNFDLQLSPFIDIALINNKITNRLFDLRDGFYAAGIEVLVYPLKWNSFTIRASFGVDVGQILFKDNIDSTWRSVTSKYEYSIGVGLSY